MSSLQAVDVPPPEDHLTQIARKIFAESLVHCSIEQSFRSRVAPLRDRGLSAFTARGAAGQQSEEVDLSGVERVFILSVGKAAAAMLRSLLGRVPFPDSCALYGVLIAPEQPRELPPEIMFFSGGHPLPDAESRRGAEAALALVHEAVACDPKKVFCFFLISGGASAMMELPLDASISLEDTAAFHQILVHSGATIEEINCVRKHFSAVKGGRLGLLAAAVPNLTLLVSDVPAGRLDALASGPTLPDPTTIAECRRIIDRYHLLEAFPATVQAFFQSPGMPETPKPDLFEARTILLLSDADLAEAARLSAEALGFTATVDNTCDHWGYRQAAEYLLARLHDLRKLSKPVCLISVGEVTVTVSRTTDGRSVGLGGRNQHFALYAATLLRVEDGEVAVLSAGSDGVDGNSPFAGATIDLNHLQDADTLASSGSPEHSSNSAHAALERFDSASFLHRIGATIETGPTGNNLRDLRIFLAT